MGSLLPEPSRSSVAPARSSQIQNPQSSILNPQSIGSHAAGPAAALGNFQFSIFNFQSPAEWDAHLRAFPQATAFHTAAWGKALSAAYGFKPCYVAVGPSDAPFALLPLMEVKGSLGRTRAISLPFTDFCPPLRRAGSELSDFGFRSSDFFRISDFGPRISTRWRSLELRGASISNFQFLISNFQSPEVVCDTFHSHSLDLTLGEKGLLSACSQNTRRNINRAKNAGITVRQDTSEAALETFYALQCRTRRKHGLPPQPKRFFQAIHEHVLLRDVGSLYLAEQGSKVVAGALFLHHGKSVIYKYGASDERHLDTGANHLIMWTAIADYAKAGFASFNFGRTELSNSGLRRYKIGFGAREHRLDYHRFDYRMNAFVQARSSHMLRLVQPIFRQLPLPVSRLFGALLYRHAA